MLTFLTIATALTGAAALADPPSADAPAETRIPRMSQLLETVVRDNRGVYVRADTGRWYYARARGDCARLRPTAPLGFITNSQGELDRFGAIRAEGWRCQLDSVTESGPPPGRRDG